MTSGRVTFGDVLRVREFRALWLADAQSMAGDQLARVALSVLVFQRTSSSALTALTYALTFLPAMVGGAFLSGLADRLPRRELMIWCDLGRAALLAVMALPGLPLGVLYLLLVAAVLIGSPFLAAESALVPSILDGEQYAVGTGLRTITGQIAQLAGFALGGVVIAGIGARGGLLIDAATFGASALLVRLAVRHRPAPEQVDPVTAGLRYYLSSLAAGARLVAADRRLRVLVGLGWLAAFYVVPEGVAVPYAAESGGGPTAAGLLMAAMPAGTALGTFVYMRFVDPEVRQRWIGALAVGTAIPLALCVFHPGLAASLTLWGISGAFCAYQVQAYAEFARAVPDGRRGLAIGIASSGLLAVQGVGILLGGLVAGALSPAAAVGLAGMVETVLGLLLAMAWWRVRCGSNRTDPEQLAQTRSGSD